MFGATGDIAPLYDLSYRAIFSVLEMAAGAEGMTISPDTEPEQGHLFRSDQLPFVKRHVCLSFSLPFFDANLLLICC